MNKMKLASLVFLAGLGGTVARGNTVAAVGTASGTSLAWRLVIGADQSATAGWSFTVGAQDVELTALGIYDAGADGLQTSHAVGIWTSGGTNLAQVVVPSGTAGTLVGSYRYESVAPTTLAAGHTYVVGAYFGPVADVCGSACGDELLAFGSETFAPGVNYVNSRLNHTTIGSGSLAFPGLDPGGAEGLFGPNFLLSAADPVGAPEPGALGLAGLGLGALVWGVFCRGKVAVRQ